MRVFNRYFIFFLLLIGLFIIFILNPSLLFTYLVNPVARILWQAVGTLRTIDQEILWALPILIAVIMGLFLLPDQPTHIVRTSYLKRTRSKTGLLSGKHSSDPRISVGQPEYPFNITWKSSRRPSMSSWMGKWVKKRICPFLKQNHGRSSWME